jgi:hypothetical protein
MKKPLISLSVAVLAASFLFTSCKDETSTVEPAKTLETKTVSNLAADPTVNAGTGQPQAATGKFTLFSFKNNAVVENKDSASNLWDIGFRGTTIIVNGGAIRSGQGGAYVYTGLFTDLKEVPANQVFSTDESSTALAITTGSGKGWYNYDGSNNWISPIAGKILVVRTGDGKYAKVEILSYYKDAPTTVSATAVARYFTFRYAYQSNGSKTF